MATALAKLLALLAAELDKADLIQKQSPSARQLASTMPFCVDTMSFAQWLQFVFIPTLQQRLVNQQALPEQLEISPMAEQVWGENYAQVQAVLRQIDQLFN